MGEDTEIATCSICGNITNVTRHYYYYDIKCDCCNNREDNHFEIVWHCANCKPVPPRSIKVWIKPCKNL